MDSFRLQNNGFRLPEKLMEELNATARKTKKDKKKAGKLSSLTERVLFKINFYPHVLDQIKAFLIIKMLHKIGLLIDTAVYGEIDLKYNEIFN